MSRIEALSGDFPPADTGGRVSFFQELCDFLRKTAGLLFIEPSRGPENGIFARILGYPGKLGLRYSRTTGTDRDNPLKEDKNE
jgi:hypothetical protein